MDDRLIKLTCMNISSSLDSYNESYCSDVDGDWNCEKMSDTFVWWSLTPDHVNHVVVR